MSAPPSESATPDKPDKQVFNLARTLQVLREEENVEVLIETTLQALQTELNYRLLWIGLYDRLDHRLYGKGGITPSGTIPLLRQRFNLASGDLLEQVVIQQRPVGVPDLREEVRAGEWRRVAQQFNIQGTIVFPIRYKDLCLGVAMLGSHLWGVSPRSEEKAVLSIILGTLGITLYQIEQTWQRQQVKHADQPLFKLLGELRVLPNLAARLEAIVEHTHAFVMPSRTNIYWFERERRYFWRRVSNQQKSTVYTDLNQSASGITLQEVQVFYNALMADQLVAIGEAHSSLKADVTTRLMQQIRARSLLAAPILFKDELLGFLAVEGSEARIWEDTEKNYVRGAAQLVGLLAPLDELDHLIEEVRNDQSMVVDMGRAIYTSDDWKSTLQECADRLCRRLKVDRFLLLIYEPELGRFEVGYQAQVGNRRLLSQTLPLLLEVDQQMIEHSIVPIAIEDLESDLKLAYWHGELLEQGVRAVLLCNTTIGSPLEGILMVAHDHPRAWSQSEIDLISQVSQQVGLMLHQWLLQRQLDQQQIRQQMMELGLTAMRDCQSLASLEQTALLHITQILNVPLAFLVRWQAGSTQGLVVAPPVSGHPSFEVTAGQLVPIQSDALVHWTLQHDAPFLFTAAQLPPEVSQWLVCPATAQLMTARFHTQDGLPPLGIVGVVAPSDRFWRADDRHTFWALVGYLAWYRRSLLSQKYLVQHWDKLSTLNWYKHGRMAEIYRALEQVVQRLRQLEVRRDGQPHQAPSPINGDKPSEEKVAALAAKSPVALQSIQYQQVLRQMEDALTMIAPVLSREAWQVTLEPQTIPLASLLRRALDRIDRQLKQRHLWSQIHNNEGNVILQVDMVKTELVLYELLRMACERSPDHSRLDLWCRLHQVPEYRDQRWLELSITDHGKIEPELLAQLQAHPNRDVLTSHLLNNPPGLHLLICQQLMQQMSGNLELYHLEDGRTLTRLLLPLSADIPLVTSRKTFIDDPDHTQAG